MNDGLTTRIDGSLARRAGEVLVRAFWEHPPLLDYFPDEEEREKIGGYFFSLPLFYGIRNGEVRATSNLEGVAIWIPSDSYPLSFWKLIRSVPISDIFGFGRNGSAKMRDLGNYIDRTHAKLAPFKHWFLQAIGVDPVHQGKGFAGVLLKQMIAKMEETGLPCYLETLEKENVSLYEHFGFKVLEESNVPGTTLTNWAMLREINNRV